MPTLLEHACVARHVDDLTATPDRAASGSPAATDARTLATGIRASMTAALASVVLLGVALLMVRHGATALAGQPNAWQIDQLEAEHQMVTQARALRPATR